jgi:TolA-binding protein
MKRTERHHLKENELQTLALQARDLFETRRREANIIGWVLVAAIVIGGGYFLWRERVQARASAMLAQAIAAQEARVSTPATATAPANPGGYPTERARLEAAVAKFKSAADTYPSTDAGVFARYQEAVGQVALGNPSAAMAAYQEVIKRSDGIYGQMARLGLAEAQARAGQYEQAINGFKEMAQRKDGPLPVDGILMQLGRAYRDAGKRSDAQQTFNRLVDEYPESPFMTEAKRELDTLNKT